MKHERDKKELTNGPNDAFGVVWAVFVGLVLSNNGLPTRVCSKGGSVCHVGCTE